MAILIIGLLAIGIYMDEFLPKDATYRGTVYSLHKSFGVIALILILIRIINRTAHKTPELPKTMPKWQIISAKITHFVLYILMFLMPLSGYLMSNSYGYPVFLFGLKMPTLAEKNYEMAKFFGECHEVFGYSLIAIIILHIGTALKHKFFDKKEHDVLPRML